MATDSGGNREDAGKSFIDCCGLNDFAAKLTNHLQKHASSDEPAYVLGLFAAPGEGKTPFVKTWQRLLTDKGLQCIHINAAERDLGNVPAFQLIGELQKHFKMEGTSEAERERQKIIAKFVSDDPSKNWPGSAELIECLEEVFPDEKWDENNHTTLMVKLSNQVWEYLSKYVNKMSGKYGRIVVFVDELDQAKPLFCKKFRKHIGAISKHISADKLQFVVSYDRGRLNQSVQSFLPGIEFDRFIKEFISYEERIPKLIYSEFKYFRNFIARLHELHLEPKLQNDFVLGCSHIVENRVQYGNENVELMLSFVCEFFDLSLRQIEFLYCQFSEFATVKPSQHKKTKHDCARIEAALFLKALAMIDETMYIKIGLGKIPPADVLACICNPESDLLIKKHGEEARTSFEFYRIVLGLLLCKENEDEIAKLYLKIEKVKINNAAIVADLTCITFGEKRNDSPEISTFTNVFQLLENRNSLFQSFG